MSNIIDDIARKIECHDFLITGDVCTRTFDDEHRPVIINYSYASEYYVTSQESNNLDKLTESLNQYAIMIQGDDGIWKRSSWINRKYLEYKGHISEEQLYLLKVKSNIRIAEDLATVEDLIGG